MRKSLLLLALIAMMAACTPDPKCSALQGCVQHKATVQPGLRQTVDPDARRRFLREHGESHRIEPFDPFLRWLGNHKAEA